MKILLFGGSGQLGYELRKRAAELNFEIVSPILSEVDITDERAVVKLSKVVSPQLIINSAAYTAVDQAENEREAAFRLNCDGARYVAQGALETGARLIYISTDYVYGNGHSAPIPESAAVAPLNVYGESKLAGETQIQEVLGGQGLIVRTSSLHGQKGINFVHTMLKLFREREKLQVVADQYMSPTWAGWLAEVVLDLGRLKCNGIVHACGKGVTTWYDFARAIYTRVEPTLDRPVTIEQTTATKFARPAARPQYSALDTKRLTSLIKREPIRWEEGLAAHLVELGFST